MQAKLTKTQMNGINTTTFNWNECLCVCVYARFMANNSDKWRKWNEMRRHNRIYTTTPNRWDNNSMFFLFPLLLMFSREKEKREISKTHGVYAAQQKNQTEAITSFFLVFVIRDWHTYWCIQNKKKISHINYINKRLW